MASAMAIDVNHYFWSRVSITAATADCWEWSGYRRPEGYGFWSPRFGDGNLPSAAHRAAYVLAGHVLNAREVLMHTCDNPPCCNPNHLRPGTQRDNMADKAAKGRARKASRPREVRQRQGDYDRDQRSRDRERALRRDWPPHRIERFWEKYLVSADGCWEWTGYRKKNGYGVFAPVRGYPIYAHRLSHLLAKGDVGPGLVVSHTCDNPSCINPGHLSAVPPAENTRQMVDRGRAAKARRKLTDQQLAAMRGDWLTGGWTQASLGARYGVSQGSVGRMLRGETYDGKFRA